METGGQGQLLGTPVGRLHLSGLMPLETTALWDGEEGLWNGVSEEEHIKSTPELGSVGREG